MILFSGLFALVFLDAIVNGPTLVGPRLYAVIAAAFVAVALQHIAGFVAAELVLIVVLAESAFLERKAKQEEAERAKAKAVEVVDDKEFPTAAKQYLLQGRDLFAKNAAADVNAFGQPWTVLATDGQVSISRSDYPNQKCKFWKAECEISGELETLKKEILDYDYRLKWDTGIASGRVLKSYNDMEEGHPDLCIFYTAPAAGGAVSSRELIDLGLLIDVEGGFDYINCSPPKGMTFKEAPTKVTGERGFTHQGSGMRIRPIPGTNKYKYMLISAIDLGGWLLPSIVNSATTGALMDSTKAMITHLEKLNSKAGK